MTSRLVPPVFRRATHRAAGWWGVLAALLLSACGGSTPLPIASLAMCADVTNVVVVEQPDGELRFDVTVQSTDTGWEKYADAWEIRAPDGTVLGTRVLTHPHVDEQPFTRSLGGVTVPEGVAEVEVAARDLIEGFCGATMRVVVP